MGKVAELTHDAVNVVSPISGSGYAGHREDNSRAYEISDGCLGSTPALMLVKNFVGTSDAKKSLPPLRKLSQRQANLKLLLSPPPPPDNGDTYGIGEFLYACHTVPKGHTSSWCLYCPGHGRVIFSCSKRPSNHPSSHYAVRGGRAVFGLTSPGTMLVVDSTSGWFLRLTNMFKSLLEARTKRRRRTVCK